MIAILPMVAIFAAIDTDLVYNNQWAFVALYLLLQAINAWLGLALVVRRCTDAGWQRWYAFLLLLPLVGSGFALALGIVKSKPRAEKGQLN